NRSGGRRAHPARVGRAPGTRSPRGPWQDEHRAAASIGSRGGTARTRGPIGGAVLALEAIPSAPGTEVPHPQLPARSRSTPGGVHSGRPAAYGSRQYSAGGRPRRHRGSRWRRLQGRQQAVPARPAVGVVADEGPSVSRRLSEVESGGGIALAPL